MSSLHSTIFCGTPEIAVPYLEALDSNPNFKVDLIITQPDKPTGRKQELTAPPVKIKADGLGIEVRQPENINDESLPECDFIITVAYGQLIKKSLLDKPSIAAVNIHYSLLPKLRGAAPVQNAILAGDKKTGVTIQLMVEKLDAGDIIGQTTIPISDDETCESLFDKCVPAGVKLMIETLSKPLVPTPQDESEVTFCKKLTREDGHVDINNMTAEEIDCKVRALVPWPGVLASIDGNEVKLLVTALEETNDSIPIECANSSVLHIVKLQVPGKKEISGKEWLRGKK